MRIGEHKSSARLLFCVMAAMVAGYSNASFAQDSKKPIRVGILVAGSLQQRGTLETALAAGLRDRGYVEGTNLVIERRYANGESPLLPQYARELADLKLDAIVTTCTDSTRSAKDATSSTPIVMAAVADPVGQHLIESLSRSGNNITGLSSQAEDILAKRLEHVAAILPKTKLIAVLVNARNPVHALMWPTLERAARQLELKLVRVDVTKSSLPAAFEEAVRAQAGAVFLLPDDPMFFNNRDRIVALAVQHRLADFHMAREFVEVGGLMSYGENMKASYYKAASYVDKVAKGAKPASLPVEQPTRFELVISAKSAQSLGLAIPQSLLLRADQVIQ